MQRRGAPTHSQQQQLCRVPAVQLELGQSTYLNAPRMFTCMNECVCVCVCGPRTLHVRHLATVAVAVGGQGKLKN